MEQERELFVWGLRFSKISRVYSGSTLLVSHGSLGQADRKCFLYITPTSLGMRPSLPLFHAFPQGSAGNGVGVPWGAGSCPDDRAYDV